MAVVMVHGVPESSAMDDEMGRCILGLYRSAGTEYRADLLAAIESASRPPWLAIEPGADPYISAELGRDVAARLGLTSAELDGRGHWWMVESAPAAADALVAFWSQLDH